ncbi:hypothetical protein ANO14919_121690 [Xylariales sp. No.14919]|nr:hypothetical protein ANO14919_121690 [Xylariales sp. No.14919]
MNLIVAMTRASDVDKLDPNIVKQAAQFLFERAAAQRRNASFKEQWRAIELAFAAFCYRRLDAARLSDLCQTVRTKFGAGVDRQLLQALAEAACRENKVWEYTLDAAGAAAYATLNGYVDRLREATELVERFAHVMDMFRNAEELGRLTVETVDTLAMIDARLPHV